MGPSPPSDSISTLRSVSFFNVFDFDLTLNPFGTVLLDCQYSGFRHIIFLSIVFNGGDHPSLLVVISISCLAHAATPKWTPTLVTSLSDAPQICPISLGRHKIRRACAPDPAPCRRSVLSCIWHWILLVNRRDRVFRSRRSILFFSQQSFS